MRSPGFYEWTVALFAGWLAILFTFPVVLAYRDARRDVRSMLDDVYGPAARWLKIT